MTISNSPWISQENSAPSLQLERVPLNLLAALARGDLAAAKSLTTVSLSPYLVSDECVGTWRRRRDQIARNPNDSSWVTRLAVNSANQVVGRAGYHGPPDKAGMVEIGYAIDPGHRRQGYARAALLILLETAHKHPDIAIVRATVRPDNIASRQLLDQHGFQEVGSQWDDEDGLEIILELA